MANPTFDTNILTELTNGLAFAHSQNQGQASNEIFQVFTADDGEEVKVLITVYDVGHAEIVLGYEDEYVFFQDYELGFAAAALDNALNVLPQQKTMFEIMDVA